MTETSNTTIDSAALAHNFGGAALLLATAKAGHLPTPFCVEVTEYQIHLRFWDRADVVAWATWIDEPLEEHPTYQSAEAELLGFQVRIVGPIADRAVA